MTYIYTQFYYIYTHFAIYIYIYIIYIIYKILYIIYIERETYFFFLRQGFYSVAPVGGQWHNHISLQHQASGLK